MAIPSILIKAVASSIPWKDVITAAPEVWKSARELLDTSKAKAEDAPAVNPADDVRAQIAALAERVHGGEQADAEQARVVAALAAQVQAITTQLEVATARSRRLQWLAGGALVAALLALGVVLARF